MYSPNAFLYLRKALAYIKTNDELSRYFTYQSLRYTTLEYLANRGIICESGLTLLQMLVTSKHHLPTFIEKNVGLLDAYGEGIIFPDTPSQDAILNYLCNVMHVTRNICEFTPTCRLFWSARITNGNINLEPFALTTYILEE